MEAIHKTDLLIIGSGLSGMSAAIFAANRNINAVVTGGAGGFEYSSGLLDLWGLSLTQKGRITKKPWAMLEKLSEQEPNHPLAKIQKKTIQQAFSELTEALKQQGVTYAGYEKKNTLVMTPFGTLRPTFRLTPSMRSNAEAVQAQEPSLILDFKGLREFSAVFVKEMMKKTWKGLRAETLEFPETRLQREVFTPFLARSLETEQVQDKFLTLIRSAVKGETWVGLPAVLGIHSSEKILDRLEAESGLKIFEIPTSPVSVPGIRLKEALMRSLENTSVTLFQNQRVTGVKALSKGGFHCRLDSDIQPAIVHAKAVLLATGRFLSRGLYADRNKIHESLLDLPVWQPESRDQWHQQAYFDPGGHRINRAGIETDAFLRPVGPDKRPVHETLFAAGTLLAHQDWIRTRCGSGLSIATAFKAMESYLQIRPGPC
jgi:glycerol-3-phosphate dehydrogenase subunit B